MRISLAAVVIALLWYGPYDQFYVDGCELLYEPGGLLPFLPRLGRWFLALKTIALLSAATLLLGLLTRLSAIVCALSFGLLNFYVSRFAGDSWSYNSHLNLFLLALCVGSAPDRFSLDARIFRSGSRAAKRRSPEFDSFLLAFMQLYAGVLYFQSGLSKLVHSGLDWFTSGQTLWVFAVRHGSAIAAAATEYPCLFVAGSLLSGLFELGFVFLLLFRRL